MQDSSVLTEEGDVRPPRSPRAIEATLKDALDRIGAFARDVFDVPLAVAGFLDYQRIWLSSRWGVDVDPSPPLSTFFDPAAATQQVQTIEDLRQSRFADHPLVTGGPRLRFYAGVPLELKPGFPMGNLSLAGPEPRGFGEREAVQLQRLAAMAVDALRSQRASARLEVEIRRRRLGRVDLWRQRRQLRRQHVMIDLTERMAHVGGWDLDLQTGSLFWSDEIYRISEVPIGRAITTDFALSFYPGEERGKIAAAIDRAVASLGSFDIQTPLVTANNTRRWVHIRGEAEVVGGVATRLIGVLQDITSHKASEAQLWHVANHDTLTNLPNRALFHDRLAKALQYAERHGCIVALFLVNLDRLKDINDSFGHDAGDAVLRAQALRLNEGLRASDTVARLGGDEFAVILTGFQQPHDVDQPLGRLLAALNAPVEVGGHLLICHASIGAAVFPDHERDAAALLKAADLALYRAKTGGRARAAMFSPAIRLERDHQMTILATVRSAVADGRVEPFYQPIISLKTGVIHGFEALLRWRDPTSGFQPPGSIMSVFDDPDLSLMLGDCMVERATADMGRWHAAGLPFGRVGLNVSEFEFRRTGLVTRLRQAVEAHGLKTSHLVIEVTETVLLSKDIAVAEAVLQGLRDAGITIALDDFGTGHASLSHLQQIPVDLLKVDHSFMRDIPARHDNVAIVSAVIGLAESLGLDVVAEGIETAEQLRFLRTLGCPRGQGFLFQPAMPASEVPAFLAAWPRRWEALMRIEAAA